VRLVEACQPGALSLRAFERGAVGGKGRLTEHARAGLHVPQSVRDGAADAWWRPDGHRRRRRRIDTCGPARPAKCGTPGRARHLRQAGEAGQGIRQRADCPNGSGPSSWPTQHDMFVIIGTLIVIGSVLGGYVMHHGKIALLNQPNEFLIISAPPSASSSSARRCRR
jgi:hypothetical protein